MGLRKREEVVADTTRRETKREDVKKNIELKRVGSLVMKEEKHKED